MGHTCSFLTRQADLRQTGEEAPLAIPLSVFGGTRDLETTPAELQAWSRHTIRRFRCRTLEGNHMFVKTQREALLRDLYLDLSQLL